MKKLNLFWLLFLLVMPHLAMAQRGGGDRRGDGNLGGDRGGRGMRFDPSSFFSRLDGNNNGVLDPEEQQGPAQFLIRRMQSIDGSIEPGKPIRIDKLREGFEAMRSGRSSNRSNRDGRGNDDRSPGDSNTSPRRDESSPPVEPLVPGFGTEVVYDAVPGFGSTAQLATTNITQDDVARARDTLSRYDSNGNQYIDQNEITRRFAGNPMDFDRNRDGRLSLDELSTRYARRRETAAQSSQQTQEPESERGDDRGGEAADLFGGRRSYRSQGRAPTTEGLPGYFVDHDQNRDGQISMAEFLQGSSKDWDEADVETFLESDFNQDGVITRLEALRRVDLGPAPKSPRTANQQAATNGSSSGNQLGSRGSGSASGNAVKQKYLDLAQRIISRYDKDGDSVLTFSEWKTMLLNPSAADANRDGKITVDEYARWTVSRLSRTK